ncbi:hypothetical protein M758_11G143600 [Ceratodon purpureus]|nr:hypothetical protein M758_11G143600 [Ceratodon purpureus]
MRIRKKELVYMALTSVTTMAPHCSATLRRLSPTFAETVTLSDPVVKFTETSSPRLVLSPQYMPGIALSLKRCMPIAPLLILPELSLMHITLTHRFPSPHIPPKHINPNPFTPNPSSNHCAPSSSHRRPPKPSNLNPSNITTNTTHLSSSSKSSNTNTNQNPPLNPTLNPTLNPALNPTLNPNLTPEGVCSPTTFTKPGFQNMEMWIHEMKKTVRKFIPIAWFFCREVGVGSGTGATGWQGSLNVVAIAMADLFNSQTNFTNGISVQGTGS